MGECFPEINVINIMNNMSDPFTSSLGILCAALGGGGGGGILVGASIYYGQQTQRSFMQL